MNYICKNCDNSSKEVDVPVIGMCEVDEEDVEKRMLCNKKRIVEKLNLQIICKNYEYENAFWFYCDQLYENDEEYINVVLQEQEIHNKNLQSCSQNDNYEDLVSETNEQCADVLTNFEETSVINRAEFSSNKRKSQRMTTKKGK